MKKRLAILIAAAMLVTSMPFYAFAEGEEAVTGGAEQTVLEGAGEVEEVEETSEAAETGETAEADETGVTEEAGEEEAAEPEAPVIINDWNEDHTAYFDENGNALAGVVREIDGKLYYFDASGLLDMTDGWKTADDGTYYVSAGDIVTAPRWIKGTKTTSKKVKYYYNKKKKKWQTKKIKKAKTKYKTKYTTVTTNNMYMFATDGKLITTKGVFEYNGSEYYGLGAGVLKTGWAAVGDNAMYFDKENGAMAKDTTVGYLQVPADGRLGKAYALGVKQLDKSGWTLKKAYTFSYKLKYHDRWYRQKTSEDYAIKGFTKKKGNCYVMAATFYIMGKLLGYDIHQVEGKVGIWPHSWTVINQGGKEWVYDPNFRNETKKNGWKIYYGKKGTWKYSKKHKMN